MRFKKDIRPHVERRKMENALFPFLFCTHSLEDEEKMKEKSTITNDYLSYVYRFFARFCSCYHTHVPVTCRRQTSNLQATLNILICLNFTIPIIFGCSTSAKLRFYEFVVLHARKMKSSDLHIN